MNSTHDDLQRTRDHAENQSLPKLPDVAAGLGLAMVLGVIGAFAGAYVGGLIDGNSAIAFGAVIGVSVFVVAGGMMAPPRIRQVVIGIAPLIICVLVGVQIGRAFDDEIGPSIGSGVGVSLGYLAINALKKRKTMT